jgi:Flp pilus assembly protein TadD
VIELKPGSNRGYEGLGNALLLEGRYGDAIAAYRRMPLPVTTAPVASNLATAYFFSGRMEEATRYFLTAVSLDPRNSELRVNLGDCYRRLGRSAEAREQYRLGIDLTRAALQMTPDDAKLGLRLVVAFAKSGECDSAIVRLPAWAQRVPPKDADLMLELAKVHALCARPREAIAILREMVRQGTSARRFQDEDEFRSLRDDPGFKQLVAGAGR